MKFNLIEPSWAFFLHLSTNLEIKSRRARFPRSLGRSHFHPLQLISLHIKFYVFRIILTPDSLCLNWWIRSKAKGLSRVGARDGNLARNSSVSQLHRVTPREGNVGKGLDDIIEHLHVIGPCHALMMLVLLALLFLLLFAPLNGAIRCRQWRLTLRQHACCEVLELSIQDS